MRIELPAVKLTRPRRELRPAIPCPKATSSSRPPSSLVCPKNPTKRALSRPVWQTCFKNFERSAGLCS